jgi:tol-pal system protein YbgF
MQQEIATLRGLLEEQQHEISQLRQENLERYQTLDSRLSDNAEAQAGSQASAPEPTNNGTAPAAPTSSSESDPAKEKLYYEASFDLIKAREFDKAQQAFTAFLRKYPNSQYAGNAQYWLGEVHLVQNDLQAAGKAFALVSHNYPEHNKVPDSLYKLADVERRLGHADKARGILQQVVAQYPDSSAAQLAQQDLRKL